MSLEKQFGGITVLFKTSANLFSYPYRISPHMPPPISNRHQSTSHTSKWRTLYPHILTVNKLFNPQSAHSRARGNVSPPAVNACLVVDCLLRSVLPQDEEDSLIQSVVILWLTLRLLTGRLEAGARTRS